jgi:phage terminase small subunit
LTDRQRRFLDAFLSGPRGVAFHATCAAEAAGYAWPGKQGPRLRTFPAIAAAIRADAERREREWRERSQERAEADIERYWQSLPLWYREGLPRPKGTRGRYRRRQGCM